MKKAAAQVQYRAREWALNELAKMYDRHAETVRGEPEYVSTGVTGSAFVPGQMMEASYRQFRYRWDALFQYVTEVLHAEPDQTLSRKGHPQDNAQYSLIGNYINTLMAVQMAAPGNTMDLA